MRKIFATVHEQLSDLTTPVGVYLRAREQYPITLLLESSDYQSKENSYSFIAFEPISRITVSDNKADIDGQIIDLTEKGAPRVSDLLNRFYSEVEVDYENENARKFNGMFCYASFESVRYFDTMRLNEAVEHPDASESIPDIQYHIFRFIIAFDHYANKLYVIENLEEGEESKTDQIISLVNKSTHSAFKFSVTEEETCSTTEAEFKEMVAKAKHHCKVGDVFQLVLSRRFRQKFKGDEFNVYRALRGINPSPYLFYFDYGDIRIMGSSPEAQIVIRDNNVEIHPIAGTVKRTGDDQEDHNRAMSLAVDPKENSEHNMLVDLARNDLSKNCTDVHVSSDKVIQYFSHVIHLVSKVEATKPESVGAFTVFEDTFPAGTLSGAPKYKAIELISSYEPDLRGFYGGAIGYVNFAGDMNIAITIRSLMAKNQNLFYQAGAGIVINSTEEGELSEVNHKSQAMRSAIDMALEI